MEKETWNEIRKDLFEFTGGKWVNTQDVVVAHAKLCDVVESMCDKSYLAGKSYTKRHIKDAFAKKISETWTGGEPIKWSTDDIEKVINNL